MIAKFAIAASFLILYPFAGELYPTEVRGIGIGFTAYLGGLGLVVIPFINYLVSIFFLDFPRNILIDFNTLTGLGNARFATSGNGNHFSHWWSCWIASSGDLVQEITTNNRGRRGIWQGFWHERMSSMHSHQVKRT